MRKWDSFFMRFLDVLLVVLTFTVIIPGIICLWTLFFKYAIPLI